MLRLFSAPQGCVTIEGPDTVVLKPPRSCQSNRQSDKSVPQTAQRFSFTQVQNLWRYSDSLFFADSLFLSGFFLWLFHSSLFSVLAGVWARRRPKESVWWVLSRSGPRCPWRRKLSCVYLWSHQRWKNIHLPGSELNTEHMFHCAFWENSNWYIFIFWYVELSRYMKKTTITSLHSVLQNDNVKTEL